MAHTLRYDHACLSNTTKKQAQHSTTDSCERRKPRCGRRALSTSQRVHLHSTAAPILCNAHGLPSTNTTAQVTTATSTASNSSTSLTDQRLVRVLLSTALLISANAFSSAGRACHCTSAGQRSQLLRANRTGSCRIPRGLSAKGHLDGRRSLYHHGTALVHTIAW